MSEEMKKLVIDGTEFEVVDAAGRQRITALENSGGGSGGSGLSITEKNLILQLFGKAAYSEADANTAYTALSNLWSGSYYSVSWEGTGYSKGNSDTVIEEGESFTSTVTANGGFTLESVAVIMGGETVQGAYSSGTITIPNVTGNIVITVTTAQMTASSISAVYTQSGTVYDTDSLDSLKADLVVTATFPDSSTAVIDAADYTLSGSLLEGTSSITVSYGGKTASFNVTVTHQNVPSGYTEYDYLTLNGLTPPAQAKTYGIWTDAQMSTDYTLEMKLYVPSDISSFSATPLFGTRSGSSGTKEYAIFYKYNNNQIGYWFDGTDSTNQPPAPSKGAVHTIKIQPVGVSETYPNAVTISIDGTDYDTGSTSTGKMFDSWFGIFNYAINANGGISNNDAIYVGQQIGEIKVTDANGAVIYDFIPCKDSSDRYGFYERINREFYYNSTYATTGYVGGTWE